MAFAAGMRLGPYEIVAPLGAGGMGEVYRARDTKLNRDVALKILPDSVAQDADRVARFKREAQVLAALNHPHIAAIYGLDESNGTQFLVLELVEGETLADRLKRGPIPVDETIVIARQIAEALAEAHEKGIIHRDLKPANIALSGHDQVKVLDFGLAKLTATPGGGGSSSVSMSPTLTTPAMLTGVGMILGTAAYMAPEQAKGREADKRCDVWAFGCVVYEMLTAKRAFEGEDITDTIASIMRSEPDWTALPTDTPANLRLLLESCLTKDRAGRAADIAVVQFLLDGRAIARSVTATSHAGPRMAGWRTAIAAVVGALLTVALTSAAWWRIRPAVDPPIIARFTLALPDGQEFTNSGRLVVAISPDGARIAYVANQRLYLRALSDLDARPIAGDGTYAVMNPAFSPDGQSIAFYSGQDFTLKKIARTGGSAVTIGTITPPLGMSWGPGGIVVGQDGKGVLRFSPNGGTPEIIVSTKADEYVAGPQMLPGGKSVLFTLLKRQAASIHWDKAQVVVQSLASGDRKMLVDGGSDARSLPTGHIVYARQGVVFAIAFDERRFDVSGGPVAMVEGVRRGETSPTGTAQFSVAGNGSLVYVPGPVATSTGVRMLALVDRKGTVAPLKFMSGAIDAPRISPDGKRLAFVTDDEKESVVWTYDLSGATAMRRLTFAGRNRFPIWSPDGQRLAFQSDRGGDLGIFSQRADGAGTAERLTTADKDTAHVPESWSAVADGLLFRVTKGTNTLSFYSLKDKTATPFGGVQSASPTNAVFSPDGRWVAYETSKSLTEGVGRAVYVQPFPATGAIYQIPVTEQGGYRHPLWSSAGNELFYIIGGDVRLRVSAITTRPVFAFGNATPIPKSRWWLDAFADNSRQYDVMPDGRRFIVRIPADSVGPAESEARAQIQVVLNWFDELKSRVPVAK